jgi:hypothetical protein
LLPLIAGLTGQQHYSSDRYYGRGRASAIGVWRGVGCSFGCYSGVWLLREEFPILDRARLGQSSTLTRRFAAPSPEGRGIRKEPRRMPSPSGRRWREAPDEGAALPAFGVKLRT